MDVASAAAVSAANNTHGEIEVTPAVQGLAYKRTRWYDVRCTMYVRVIQSRLSKNLGPAMFKNRTM